MTKILIVKLSSLGDIIHTLPIPAALKESNPKNFVAWLVGRQHSQILENHPYIDQTILFERERWRGINAITKQNEIWELVHQIRKMKFDVVFDLQGLFRSGFFTLFSGARERFGFAHARELAYFAYNKKIEIPSQIIHAVDKNAYLVEQWLGHTIERKFHIDTSSEDKKKAESWLPNSPSIVIVPSSRWASKCWPPKYFAQLMDEIIQLNGISIALVGGKSDLELSHTILKQTNYAQYSNNVINLIGKTSLKELAAVLARATIVISNDSGPMHIAAAMGTSVIALFGPTVAEKTGPYKNHCVLQVKPSCWPCRNKFCLEEPSCMSLIKPHKVLNTIQNLLLSKKIC